MPCCGQPAVCSLMTLRNCCSIVGVTSRIPKRPPFFTNTTVSSIVDQFQITPPLAYRFRIDAEQFRHLTLPATAELCSFDSGIPSTIFFIQAHEQPLHLPFRLCRVAFHHFPVIISIDTSPKHPDNRNLSFREVILDTFLS
jgi:hypothetical protein